MKTPLKQYPIYFFLAASLILQGCKADKKAGETPATDSTAVTYSTWMADSEINRNPEAGLSISIRNPNGNILTVLS